MVGAEALSGRPRPQGQKAKGKAKMLLFHRFGMAQRAGNQAQAGSQAPFHSVLDRQGRGLFFVSISDYYLTIIEIFSGEAHCPGQPLESPNPREPGSITRLHSPPQTLLPLVFQVFSYSSLICVLFPYYPPMVWICSAHEMHMMVICRNIKRLLFVYFQSIKCVTNGCWMAIGI